MDPAGSLGLRTHLRRCSGRREYVPGATPGLWNCWLASWRLTGTPLSQSFSPTPPSLPGDVVDVLVGEAFNRLDELAQQVMQALAVFPAAVPAVAVDYLLQPYRQAIDSAPVLGRLVNMHFAKRDAGRYYLHQVDRDYAFGRVPVGEFA